MTTLQGDFREVTHFGVTHLLNQEHSVAQFESWQDVEKGTSGAISGHRTYRGVPVTQAELDTYYRALKKNTGLTKSKIGSGKVLYRDLKMPIAIEYQGKVFVVAPFAPPPPEATWIRQPPSAAPPLTSEELLTRARELGKLGYGVGWHEHTQDLTLSVLCHNPEQEPSLVVKMIEAWKKGWQAAQKTAAKPAAEPKKQPAARKPAPDMPPILTAPPELAADVLGGGAKGMTQKELLARAEKLGRAGFLAGKQAPAQDAKILNLCYIDQIPHPLRMELMTAWSKGWQAEHQIKTDKELREKGIITPRMKATAKRKPAPTQDIPPALTAPPELAVDVLGGGMGLTPTPAAPRRKPKKQPATRKPAPDLPPILVAPPELTADVLGTGPMGLTPTAAPKSKPAARTTKKQPKKTAAAKTRKTAKKPAKPKTKKTAATPKLTASQREYLAIQGFVMVKRGGKYVRITG